MPARSVYRCPLPAAMMERQSSRPSSKPHFTMMVQAMKRFFALVLSVGALLGATGALIAAPPAVQLAQHGRALLPIVVSPQASAAVRQQAAVLAEYLGRIGGAPFAVTPGDGQTGLAVGVSGDFPAIRWEGNSHADRPGADELYLLRSHAKGLYVIGASEIAVQHAAWDLLYRLGYRQFFPGQPWEVVPKIDDLKIAVDALEQPDYAYRIIWYGCGTWDYNAEPLRQWQIRNRAAGSFQLNTGHAYDGILRRCRAEFRAHPEYLGLVDGQRSSSKFCISNPGLRKLVVRDALDWIAEHPDQSCVSMEPSDGGGWCECQVCRAMGSPSDRALTLANEVSAVLEEKYPGKYVAMYAYNQHAPPPTIRARPRVIVSCATAFLTGGWTIDAVIEGWKRQGVAQFGIREYYSVNTWDRDLPGAAHGSRLDYLARTIPAFHAQGARFLSAESSDNWGPNGLGYYIATRILWDVREAGRVDSLVADFLQKAFGPAQQPMAQFYQLLNGRDLPLMSHDLIGRMYRLLREASAAGGDGSIQARLDSLILYTRYVELFRAYQTATGPQRQQAFERVIRHAYRMRRSMMVHTKALYRDLVGRDKAVTIPQDAGWSVPEPKNPWKSSTPWTREELDRMVADGIGANRLAELEEVSFRGPHAPAARLQLPDLPPLADAQTGRNTQTFYTWFGKSPATLELKITGGLITGYRDRGNVQVDLFAAGADGERLVDHNAAVPPDGKQRTVLLKTDRTGLHKVVVSDGGDSTEVLWPAGVPRTIEISRASAALTGRRSGYFYVPPGTRTVGGYGPRDPSGSIKDSGSHEVFRFSQLDGPDYFQIAVPPGQDGKLWSFHAVPGRLILLTVPPYFARTSSELLLPQ